MANNIGGRRTNIDDWKKYAPLDVSMNNVVNIYMSNWDFGVPK